MNYVDFAFSAYYAATTIRHMIIAGTLSGPAIVFAVQPTLNSLTALLHKADIPDALVQELAQSAADIINNFYRSKA